jgi:hypothetical protein
MSKNPTHPLLATIPPPDDVRLRLSQLAREARLLRGLLRLSKAKQDAADREQQQLAERGQYA